MSNTSSVYHAVNKIKVENKILPGGEGFSEQRYVYVTIEAGDDTHTVTFFSPPSSTELDLEVAS
jgi:hypothetical protein